MKAEWKSPKMTSPVIPEGKSSVCVMVTPGDALASHPMKAWYNGDGNYWLANSGDKADVQGWDYYPCRMENGCLITTNTKGREMIKQQYTLMKFDPTNMEQNPYPSQADQFRDYHGLTAWIFNPWTGKQRDPRDIGSDIQGNLIIPPGETVKA